MLRVLPFRLDIPAPWRKATALAWPAASPLTRPVAVAGLLLLFALVWLGHLQSVALTVPMDNVEQWVWSHSLQWGYHKHPPLPTWGLWLAHQVAGKHALTAAVLGALCALASVGFMYQLLRQMWSPFAAWLAVLASLSITFYSGRLNYYNHNITLMLCVSLTVYCWWQILQSGKTRWWITLGLAAGLGMLSKYQYLLVLPPSLVCLLWLRPWVSRKVAIQLALALAIATLLFLPHGLWLLSRAVGDGPLAYAMHSAKPTGFGGHSTLAAMQHSGIWLLDLILNRCLPAWLFLGLVARPASRPAVASGAAVAGRKDMDIWVSDWQGGGQDGHWGPPRVLPQMRRSVSTKPASMKFWKPRRSSSVKPFLPRLGLGLARSFSVWATLRSPQKTTGLSASSRFTYAKNAGSQCRCRSGIRLKSSLALGV